MTSRADDVLQEVNIQAAPETVFEFFVDPVKLTRWLAVEAELDPRPGGICRQVHAGADRGDGPYHMYGTFLEVDPPHPVVFTWGFTNRAANVPPGSSLVEVTLSRTGSGTRLLLRHSGLSELEQPRHAGGWTGMLGRLAAAAAPLTVRRPTTEDA